VLLDGLPVFERYGLLLAGGYAFRAHEILHRSSQDLDFATRDDTPLPEIAKAVQLAFQRAGYGVRVVEATRGWDHATMTAASLCRHCPSPDRHAYSAAASCSAISAIKASGLSALIVATGVPVGRAHQTVCFG
jgi:hypothetical protein